MIFDIASTNVRRLRSGPAARAAAAKRWMSWHQPCDGTLLLDEDVHGSPSGSAGRPCARPRSSCARPGRSRPVCYGPVVVDAAERLGGHPLLAVEGLGVGHRDEAERGLDDSTRSPTAGGAGSSCCWVSAWSTGKKALNGTSGMTEVTPAVLQLLDDEGRLRVGGGGLCRVRGDGLDDRGVTPAALEVGQQVLVEGQLVAGPVAGDDPDLVPAPSRPGARGPSPRSPGGSLCRPGPSTTGTATPRWSSWSPSSTDR